MTFKERCKKFVLNTENEQNHFKKVYRAVFLNKKISDYERDEKMFKNAGILYKRPKDHCKAKQIIKKDP